MIKEGGDDIELKEFKDEFGDELFQVLLDLGIETARDFLDADVEELLEIDGMTKGMLLELRNMILTEFDENEDSDVYHQIMSFDMTLLNQEVSENKEMNVGEIQEISQQEDTIETKPTQSNE